MANVKKKIAMKCIGISLNGDGSQQVHLEKAAEPPTAKSGSATVVRPSEASLGLTITEDEAANWSVGKEYSVEIK